MGFKGESSTRPSDGSSPLLCELPPENCFCFREADVLVRDLLGGELTGNEAHAEAGVSGSSAAKPYDLGKNQAAVPVLIAFRFEWPPLGGMSFKSASNP